MSLTLSAEPGFTELTDSTFDSGNPVTSAAMKSLNSDAKFAAVRCEQFYGYYRNGETVLLPVSTADGYQYSRSELLYSWSILSSSAAPGALNGTQSIPTPAATSGGGTVLYCGGNVNQVTGAVFTTTSYFNTSQHDTNDGILMVVTHALRNR